MIQVLQPKFRVDETLDVIKQAMEKKWTGMGYLTTEFETKWKEYSNFNNAHFVNSGTSALHLALAVFKEQYDYYSTYFCVNQSCDNVRESKTCICRC